MPGSVVEVREGASWHLLAVEDTAAPPHDARTSRHSTLEIVMQALAPQTAPDPRRWWALALLCGAFFMVILDAAIVIVCSTIDPERPGFSEQGLQWVVSAYALTFGGLLLLGGAGDLLGRRRVLMVGLGFFTLAQCSAGSAPVAGGAVITARAVQGVGAAIMTPTTHPSTTFTSAEAH